jgi:hypothetical protein
VAELTRAERLQIMLTEDELRTLDDWRFARRMPSRAAAVRELLKRGLAADGFSVSDRRKKSQEYSVLTPPHTGGDDAESCSAAARLVPVAFSPILRQPGR